MELSFQKKKTQYIDENIDPYISFPRRGWS